MYFSYSLMGSSLLVSIADYLETGMDECIDQLYDSTTTMNLEDSGDHSQLQRSPNVSGELRLVLPPNQLILLVLFVCVDCCQVGGCYALEENKCSVLCCKPASFLIGSHIGFFDRVNEYSIDMEVNTVSLCL